MVLACGPGIMKVPLLVATNHAMGCTCSRVAPDSYPALHSALKHSATDKPSPWTSNGTLPANKPSRSAFPNSSLSTNSNPLTSSISYASTSNFTNEAPSSIAMKLSPSTLQKPSLNEVSHSTYNDFLPPKETSPTVTATPFSAVNRISPPATNEISSPTSNKTLSPVAKETLPSITNKSSDESLTSTSDESLFPVTKEISPPGAPVPGLGPATALMFDIIRLCEAVPQNRNAARCLVERCQNLYEALERYEKKPIPDSTVQPRDAVFKCLNRVKDAMQKWSEKSSFDMLLFLGEFETEFKYCNTAINDCLRIFSTIFEMETLVHQKEWRMDLKQRQDADHKAIMEELAAADFMRRVTESKILEGQNDVEGILVMMRKGLAEHKVMSDEGRKRMAKNLYKLLQLSNIPPECQLDSGEVEFSGEVPIDGGENFDMYKGLYLQSEDVRIKVIRSVIMKDENTVKRIRREVELWSTIYAVDKGKHVIPFYGFYSPDGIRLALVSPWVNNGNALAYVKKNDGVVNYKKLIIGIAEGIEVLHSMKPPIIHGNLRAENVLVGDQNQPLITDFALAKLEGNMMTQSNDESDSYRWSAPEMSIEHATMSFKGDIYSFGMTILELFTHEIPYANIDRDVEVYYLKDDGLLPDRPQDERVIKRGLDNRMWELLCECWSISPEDRPTIDELSAKLSEGHVTIHEPMDRSRSLNKTEIANDVQLNQKKLLTFTSVPLLLATLSELKALGNSPVNETTLRYARELLDLPDFSAIRVPCETWSSSNVKLLLDFILSLFRENMLIHFGAQDATQRVRQLMLQLTLADVMPESLFITGVKMDVNPLAVGGYGRVFRGDYKGKQVALKMVDKSRKDGSLRQDFCREALVWRSLSHRCLLPLLGIYEDRSQLYLVSPFMTNKTLRQWREEHTPAISDLHKMMLEVAEGVQYVHSEGIVHGDLHGGNILLDSDLSCKIADFGSSRHLETGSSRPTRALSIHFAAPELFGLCIKCGQSRCSGCYEGDEKEHREKTMESDVYAFGCLYYEIFFNTIPFHESNEFQTIRFIINGERPSQLQSPEMGDNTWHLIQSCWESVPSKRPKMTEIVEALALPV